MIIAKTTTFEDIKIVSEWAKDEKVRKWIYIDDWFEYFEAVRDNENYYLLSVFEKELLSIVMAEKSGRQMSLALIVDPQKQNRKIGQTILKRICRNYQELFRTDIDTLYAGIYPNNTASIRCFEKAGFIYQGTGMDGELIYKLFLNPIQAHYDLLIDEGHDPVHDPAPLREYMNKWDGQAFINELGLSGREDVLEIGVGTGRLAIQVCSHCRSFTGIDLSPKTVKRALENLAEQQNCRLICDDFMTYDFNEQFDVIYSSLTFMHIKNKLAAVKKAAALLKKGGRFVLSIDKNPNSVLDYGTRKIEIYPDTPDDIRRFIKASKLELIKQFDTEFASVFAAQAK